MQQEPGPIASASLTDRLKLLSTKAKLLTLGNLDKRGRAYRKTVEIISALEGDLGGDPTTAQRQLIQRAALTAALVEDIEVRWLGGEMIDPVVHATLTNSLRRLLATIGLERRPRDVTADIHDIAHEIAAEAEAIP